MTGLFPCPVQAATRKNPDHPALVDEGRILTYGQLEQHVAVCSDWLKRQGIGPGDVVAVLDTNSAAYIILFWAAMRARCMLMPLNIRLTPEDWRQQLTEAGARILICSQSFKPSLADISVDIGTFDDIPQATAAEFSLADTHQYNYDRDALIIFSSGSGGAPHGVVLTCGNLYYSAQGTASALPLRPDDTWLAVLPFFHIGGMTIPFRTALAGAASLVLPKFDAGPIVSLVADGRVSHLSLVPTMLAELIDADPDNCLRTAEAIILGGASWDLTLKRHVIERRLPVLTTYGMTETTSMVTLLPANDPADRLVSSGRVLPYRQIRIVHTDGRDMPPGKTGRILVAGEILFSRYLGQTSSPISPDGWFDTGDIGQLDVHGYLTVTGRADRIIVSGGENIDLDYVEKMLTALEPVAEAAVIAGADARWGRRPIAVVRVTDKAVRGNDLRSLLTGKLPAFMIPDRFIVVETLPLTASGKHDRRALEMAYGNLPEETR